MSVDLSSLPNEIHSAIAQWIGDGQGSLVALAATNRQCQFIAEEITFKSLTITSSEVAQFSRITTTTRFRALRHLTYTIIAPDDTTDEGDNKSRFRTTAANFEACSHHFTRAIVDILTALKEKSTAIPEANSGIDLYLICSRFPKVSYLVEEDSAVHIPSSDDNYTGPYAMQRGWVRLQLESLSEECIVPTIKKLGFYGSPHGGSNLNVWAASLPEIASRLPRLKVVDWSASDDERKDLRARRRARDAFARSLAMLPDSVSELHLTYGSSPPGDESFLPLRLTDTKLDYDVFSHEVGILSQRLVKLHIRGATFDLADFFQADRSKTWAHLECLELVHIPIGSPDGSYYFDPDPRMSQEDIEDQLNMAPPSLDDMLEYMEQDELPALMDVRQQGGVRTSTSPTHFKRIYLACAEAVKRMPILQRLFIEFDVMYNGEYGHCIHQFSYGRGAEVPHSDRYQFEKPLADIKVSWILSPMIEIDGQGREAWEDVGKVKHVSVELFRSDSMGFNVPFERLESYA